MAMGYVMPSLSVRQLDENTLQALRVQAAQHHVSMEEEARRILRSAVRPQQQLGNLAIKLFQPAWALADDTQPFELPPREHDLALDFSK